MLRTILGKLGESCPDDVPKPGSTEEEPLLPREFIFMTWPSCRITTSAASMSGEKISEVDRERETFRHDPTLLSGVQTKSLNEPNATLKLSTKADPILTALAQLGACRTGASRAFISLFDRAHQYIIAETTRESSLRTEPGSLGVPDEELFWLRGTAIPRSHGICSKFLNTVRADESDRDIKLPVNIIQDIHGHPEITKDNCVLFDSPARGYAGVPIRSRNGVDFGEYSVVTEHPIRDCDWGEAESKLLREISLSILEHLLSKNSQVESERAKKKTAGIKAFVEQRLALRSSQHDPTRDGDHENPFAKDLISNRNIDAPRVEHGSPYSIRPSPQANAINDPKQSPLSVERKPTSIEDDPLTAVFSRAANTIRESIDADGVVFFDASSGSFNLVGSQYTGSDASQLDTSDEESWHSDTTFAESSLHQETHTIASSKSENPQFDDNGSPPPRAKLSFRALSALLRRYAKGAIFDYDENGQLQPSSEERSPQPPTNTINNSPGLTKKRTSSFIGNLGNEVSKAFYGARSVVFVPVWDPVRKRWRAGCFAYTYDKTRFFTSKCDLSYLFAFATLAMAEIASHETNLANQAQSDVLGSLSHELRSPLHGIILGVEFLSDTSLSVFQGNLLHILETCGRTLSDTIDHLLYYAKVNNFIPPGKTSDSRARGLRKEMNNTLQAGMKSITTPVRLDVLVEDVTESIFAGFNFQRLSIGQYERSRHKSHADIYAMRRDDSFQATEDLKDWLEEGGEGCSITSTPLVIDLAIDAGCSHYYYAISGAVRRIVMNLFGNALKFTCSGTIRVELTQEVVHTKKSRNNNTPWVKIVVADTGRGITDDFMANHMFQEFQQENGITPGLGLGLCVVRKIVSSLKGKVTIASKFGVGTTATVLLPLQPVIHSPAHTGASELEFNEYAKEKRQLKGLRVCFIGFDTALGLPNYKDNDYQSIWSLCRTHLGMEIVLPTQALEIAPDIVLCEESALHHPFVQRDTLSRTPLVVICGNALNAYRLSIDPRFRDTSVITEFISQPTGPRKLAKVLIAALQRWIERQDQLEPPDNTEPLSLRRVSTRSHEEHEVPSYGNGTFNILNMTGPCPFETSTAASAAARASTSATALP
ncbi:hypothetical protein NPX13_g1061 [Xylaria arbuscula]|uniref:histidine kinase n=1 Tax=Xylaria arbuscula TaxID=114810 RepID=A0A9W8TRL9_9PEZI|nr:hypothetical protein NPX13_g1061 [Xylaria arbuscula]